MYLEDQIIDDQIRLGEVERLLEHESWFDREQVLGCEKVRIDCMAVGANTISSRRPSRTKRGQR